ncbi:2488_t:CDS:2, partial [Scutellospora calospora]
DCFFHALNITSKQLNDLKNIHTISIFSIILNIITKQGGKDKFYSNHKKYFENDGIAKDLYLKISFEKIMPNTLISEYFGTNVVFSDGHVWKRHRRICNPAFKTLPIHLFVDHGLKLMDVLEKIDDKPVEIKNLMQNLFKEIIKKKREDLAAGKFNGDLLEYMINNNDDQMLSDNELRYNLAVFMMAGHNTTLNALTAILYLLSTHKNVQEKTREEILRILGDDLTPS